MDKEFVINEVALIEACKGDDEAAHSYEDALHQKVLAVIALGAPNAAELAVEALKTQKIQFNRWCA